VQCVHTALIFRRDVWGVHFLGTFWERRKKRGWDLIKARLKRHNSTLPPPARFRLHVLVMSSPIPIPRPRLIRASAPCYPTLGELTERNTSDVKINAPIPPLYASSTGTDTPIKVDDDVYRLIVDLPGTFGSPISQYDLNEAIDSESECDGYFDCSAFDESFSFYTKLNLRDE